MLWWIQSARIPWPRSCGVAKKGGFIVSLVAQPDPVELEDHQIRGAPLSVEPNSDELAEITKLIDVKKVKVIVSHTYALADAVKAQERASTNPRKSSFSSEVGLRVGGEVVIGFRQREGLDEFVVV